MPETVIRPVRVLEYMARRSASRLAARDALIEDILSRFRQSAGQPGTGVLLEDKATRARILDGINHRGLSVTFVGYVYNAGARALDAGRAERLDALLLKVPTGKVSLARVERVKVLGPKRLSVSYGTDYFGGVDIYADVEPVTDEEIERAREKMFAVFPDGRRPSRKVR